MKFEQEKKKSFATYCNCSRFDLHNNVDDDAFRTQSGKHKRLNVVCCRGGSAVSHILASSHFVFLLHRLTASTTTLKQPYRARKLCKMVKQQKKMRRKYKREPVNRIQFSCTNFICWLDLFTAFLFFCFWKNDNLQSTFLFSTDNELRRCAKCLRKRSQRNVAVQLKCESFRQRF